MGAAAIVSSIFVLTMARSRRQASTSWWNSVCVVGVGLGLAVGFYVLSLRFSLPPVNALDRLLLIVVPVGLSIEFLAGFPRVPRWAAWLFRLSLAAAIPRILLHSSVYLSGSAGEWSLWQAVAVMAVCSTLLAGVWSLLARLSRGSGGVAISLALCLTILCAGLTVMLAGYIGGGSAAFPMAGALLATTIGARYGMRQISVPTGSLPAAVPGTGVVCLFGLLFVGCFFGRLSGESALVMLLAPLLCWVAEIPLMRHRKAWLVTVLRLALVAILLAVVLVMAKRRFDRDMAPLLGKAQVSEYNLCYWNRLSQHGRGPC